jgi:outer membrane protein, heavy metal efflux system
MSKASRKRHGNQRICRLLATFLLFARAVAAQPGVEQKAQDPVAERQRFAQQLLDDYVKLALAKSPTLSGLRAKHVASREMVAPAGALPDPMVGVMYQSMGPPWQPMAPMSMVQGEISQAIPGAGKRQARRDVAQAEANIRGASIEASKARIAADVRSLFAQIFADDREQQALESAGELIKLMVGAIAGQFASGRVDQEAFAKADYERNRLNERLIDVKADREILVAKLNRVLARPPSATVPPLEALPEVSVDGGQWGEGKLVQASELRVQRAAIAAASRRRENAETEAHPDFLVGLAGGATTTGAPLVTLRFGVELPIWRSSKQDPLIRAARSDVEATESEYRAMELKVRGEMTELLARFKRDSNQIRLYRDAILPSASLTLNAARDAYSTGRAGFATVIEDFRIWLEAQVGLSRRQADQLMTWAELEAILAHSY